MKEVISGNLAMGVRDIVKGRKKIKRENEHIANGKYAVTAGNERMEAGKMYGNQI